MVNRFRILYHSSRGYQDVFFFSIFIFQIQHHLMAYSELPKLQNTVQHTCTTPHQFMALITDSYPPGQRTSSRGWGRTVNYQNCKIQSDTPEPPCVNSGRWSPTVTHLVNVPVVGGGVDALPFEASLQLLHIPDPHGATHDLPHVGHQQVHLQVSTRTLSLKPTWDHVFFFFLSLSLSLSLFFFFFFFLPRLRSCEIHHAKTVPWTDSNSWTERETAEQRYAPADSLGEFCVAWPTAVQVPV